MSKAYLIATLSIGVFALGSIGCAHQTSMTDRKLAPLWAGNAMPDEAIMKAKKEWPNDTTLLDLQESTAILRHDVLNEQEIKRAKQYLESAYNTFEDLRDPENFSKAFTQDDQTPFRGKPFERMLAAILVALLDTSDNRCDMAIPALKAAEFLDARWQPFQFGSDAPLVYALMLRCLHETKASPQDVARAQEGLRRALRVQLFLEPFSRALNRYAKAAADDPAYKIGVALLEVGVPSALIAQPADADLKAILAGTGDESLRFLFRVLKDKEAPYDDIIRPLLKQIEGRSSKDNNVSENASLRISTAIKKIWEDVLKTTRLAADSDAAFEQLHRIEKKIAQAVKSKTFVVRFEGFGPRLVREGAYNEIARIVPVVPKDVDPGVTEKHFAAVVSCGVTNAKGNLTFAFCDKSLSGNTVDIQGTGLKLWSSSFQATTTAGRRFDRILKGRAQFRMGTEIVALVGGVIALQLLELSTATRGPESEHLRSAAAIVGIAAGTAWLIGRASNPEADVRRVTVNFESGYLISTHP